MDMILFDNSSLNMLYHVTNNSALPIVLAGSVQESWNELCGMTSVKKNATWNVKYRKIANVMEAKQELRRKKNKKTKQMLQPEKADN